MDGRDQGRLRGRDDVPDVVHDVHGTRRSFHHRTAQPLPGLVERSSRERELAHGDRRPEGVRRRVPMASGHADEIEVTPLNECPEQLHR